MKNLLEFINASPTAFHAVATLTSYLKEEGFEEVKENQSWQLNPGKSYYVTRNQSSLIAFRIPECEATHFQIVASHSDSPTFKIKENPSLKKQVYTTLNVEKYGGMIMSTWLDRPLSIAGRVMVATETGAKSKLINIDRDLMIIPHLAIHMNRKINDGYAFNPQVDLLPLLGDEKTDFEALIANEAGVGKKALLSYDLSLYPRVKATLMGAQEIYIGAPRLDDLECAYASVKGLIYAKSPRSIALAAIFDNEEVGSGTKQGADSTFLKETMQRIAHALGREDYESMVNRSFMVSSDNAHALHPNHSEAADPINQPFLNKGIVIKYSANQKYTSDAYSASVFKTICNNAHVPYQIFTNRSDMLGGSTLGNISTAQVSMKTVDVGLPQLAMHSCFETAGVYDLTFFEDALIYYYNHELLIEEDEYSFQ